MQAISTNHGADVLVTADQGEPLLVVEVKRRHFNQTARQQIAAYAKGVGAKFVMYLDPKQILVAPTRDGTPEWEASNYLADGEYS